MRTPSRIHVATPLINAKFLQNRDTITVNFTPALDSPVVLLTVNVDDPALFDTVFGIIAKTANSVKFIAPLNERFSSDSANVRIEDKTGFDTAGFSPSFKLKHIILNTPVDNGTYAVGQPVTVTWDVAERSDNSSLLDGVVIKLSIDGGITWAEQGSGTIFKYLTDGSGAPNPQWRNFPVTINTATQEALVKVQQYSVDSNNDLNARPFKVQ